MDFAQPSPRIPEYVAQKSKRTSPLANARPTKNQPKKAKKLSASERSAKPQALRSTQAIVALIAMIALEAVFAAMARLGDLADHVPEFMALALGAGVLYFIVLYGLEHTRDSRAVLWLVLLGALAFRLTLFPYPPSLSTDVQRYRWDGHVQNAGWN